MDDPELNKLIEDASKVLNLKGHNVGFPSNQKFIYTCCDLEGHKGKDNKYYLLDFARIAPPEPPSERFNFFLFKKLNDLLFLIKKEEVICIVYFV